MRFLFLFFAFICHVQFGFAQKKMTPEEYINKYFQLAVDEMNLYKVPASITLAQGLIETESGNSLLATKANNHFGIKCKAEWTGATFIKDDDTKNECFRAYNSAEESFRDHSLFLLKPRYSTLFTHDMTDYRSWAYGLKQAGYATNPNYPAMLIKFIEDYKLFQFDNYGLEKPAASLPKSVEKTKPQLSPAELIKQRKELANNLELIIVDENFDIYKVATIAKQSVGSLMEYNDLEGEQTIRNGQNFFLQKKGKTNVMDKHLVLLGESLYDISQIYGVSLKILRKYNKLETWEQPNVGETIYLSRLREDFIKTRPFYQVNKERLEKNLELFIPVKSQEEKSNIKLDTPIVKSQEELPAAKSIDLPKTAPTSTIRLDSSIVHLDIPAHLPKDTALGIEAKPTESLPINPSKTWINHQVKSKETIFRISKVYDCAVNDILNWNAITIEQGLKIGQVLRIHTMHPNGLALSTPVPSEDIKTDDKPISKPKTPLAKTLVQKPVDTPKMLSLPSSKRIPLEGSKKNSLSVPNSSIPNETNVVPKVENSVPAGNSVTTIKIDPTVSSQKQAPIINQEVPKEIPKQTPREPQKPRVVILKAPPAKTPAPNMSNTGQEKSNMSDLYKSLMKNAETDTSVKRIIKVSE